VEGSDFKYVHNIGVKPGDPAADVLFALAFYYFHSKLLSELDKHQLGEAVHIRGNCIVPTQDPFSDVKLGAPPYMDDLFIPVSASDPLSLLQRIIKVTNLLDSVATEFSFTIQYGVRKTEVVVVLGGRGKADAIAQLRPWTIGQGLDACLHIQLGNNKAIRVVNGYKHLGAMANAAVKFNAEIVARTAAAGGIEAAFKKGGMQSNEIQAGSESKHCGRHTFCSPICGGNVAKPHAATVNKDFGQVFRTPPQSCRRVLVKH
jgi:hypothetical protein